MKQIDIPDADSPARTSRDEAREATRRRLVEAALKVTERSGLDKLTLEAVAAEAGVSKGGLLYHFSSKQRLVTAMLEDMSATFLREFDKAIGAEPNSVGRSCRAYVTASLTKIRAGRWAGLFAGALADRELLGVLTGGVTPSLSTWRRLDEAEGLDPTIGATCRMAIDGLWIWVMLGQVDTVDENHDVVEHVLRMLDEAAVHDKAAVHD